jgi:type IV secretory pathway component VirB8
MMVVVVVVVVVVVMMTTIIMMMTMITKNYNYYDINNNKNQFVPYNCKQHKNSDSRRILF